MELTLQNVQTLDTGASYGKFVIEPLERGYGATLGSSLRRVLLSSIPGAAITYVKIDKVMHEFSTIPGVKEDTTELLLNLKGLNIRVHPSGDAKEPKTIRIDRKGEGVVTGADVECPSDVEVVNPEVYLATINDNESTLSIEMTIETNKGYVLPDRLERRSLMSIGTIPMGAAFTPVRKVNYIVEQTRVQSNTNLERLVLEVWTNGTITPETAISEAAKILVGYFKLFEGFRPVTGADPKGGAFLEPRPRRAACAQHPHRRAGLFGSHLQLSEESQHSDRSRSGAVHRERSDADPQLRAQVANRSARKTDRAGPDSEGRLYRQPR